MKVLEQKVAWVVEGGAGLAREVALLLAARGASVLVSGPEERALGETVGEIAFGGGKARHVVVPAGGDHAPAAARARAVFGRLDLVLGPRAAADELRTASGAGVAFVALEGDGPEPVVEAAARALGG